jgi:hypothetical protein
LEILRCAEDVSSKFEVASQTFRDTQGKEPVRRRRMLRINKQHPGAWMIWGWGDLGCWALVMSTLEVATLDFQYRLN